ncbi:hypothetical protein D779_1369 [Imhoffiella purpurea]|uniref:Uncharacterized protein n=1 Tax=Imhoffiella purpurea TaxID=1249627 RepID=W9VYE6_9GAMM|nr:hypothetical protein D779_1369 [Imhoffiella purpurea]
MRDQLPASSSQLPAEQSARFTQAPWASPLEQRGRSSSGWKLEAGSWRPA